ncbi:hypothetical protein HHK36_006633 [Tetracentron sinense]|uniref:Cupin type-1 domain-containing protein n=1 Tax=Tetracentron sinense TaxID=13715 RepID=A0A834ZHU0_TETSI|nr:hypothetical protein HHK36_006633 [Tetracentron sinense]
MGWMEVTGGSGGGRRGRSTTRLRAGAVRGKEEGTIVKTGGEEECLEERREEVGAVSGSTGMEAAGGRRVGSKSWLNDQFGSLSGKWQWAGFELGHHEMKGQRIEAQEHGGGKWRQHHIGAEIEVVVENHTVNSNKQKIQSSNDLSSHPSASEEKVLRISTKKMGAHFLIATVFLALTSSLAFASDPSPLQDFCVAVDDPKLFVNGKFCKDPKLATAEDFSFKGLDIAGNTSNKVGSNVTQVNVAQIAGLNTLGVSLARIDYAPYGLNPPHTHPRATEILTVLEGTLYVGFVTSNPENRLFTKVLNKGDVFVFPQGLIHFQFNTGHSNAVAIAGFGSQNPGVITIANAVFGSKPPISDDVLAKAFQVDKKVVDYLQAQFWVNN